MAEKLVQGDSLATEVFDKFNGMADEVNALKASGGGSSGGGAIVELSGESGKLTDEQYLQCTNPTTVIKWFNGSGAHIVYEYWRFASPTYEFKSVYIDADECINNIIEIDQINHSWKRKSTEYSGGGGSADALIDVDSLSFSGTINKNAIYRVTETTCNTFFNGFVNNLGAPVTIHTVDTLPATGEPIYDNIETPTKITGYYQKSDGNVYAWLPTAMGVPNDMWMPLESVLAIENIPYGGFVTSTTGLPNGTVYLFLEYSIKLYHYKEGWQLLGDGNNKSRVFAISASDGVGEDTTEGDYTLMQLGGYSLIQCTELFSRLRSKHLNIASIQYTSRVGGGQGISVPAKLVSTGGHWHLDVNLEGFYQTKSVGLALRDDGVLIYTTDDWNFLALAYFQIVVTTF